MNENAFRPASLKLTVQSKAAGERVFFHKSQNSFQYSILFVYYPSLNWLCSCSFVFDRGSYLFVHVRSYSPTNTNNNLFGGSFSSKYYVPILFCLTLGPPKSWIGRYLLCIQCGNRYLFELNKKKPITSKRENPIEWLSGLCDWDVLVKKHGTLCIVAKIYVYKYIQPYGQIKLAHSNSNNFCSCQNRGRARKSNSNSFAERKKNNKILFTFESRVTGQYSYFSKPNAHRKKIRNFPIRDQLCMLLLLFRNLKTFFVRIRLENCFTLHVTMKWLVLPLNLATIIRPWPNEFMMQKRLNYIHTNSLSILVEDWTANREIRNVHL